jgi:hypothetical protein
MLISHRKNFIYTKTVKTAGTSVESYFEPFCMREGEWVFKHKREEYISDAGIVGVRGSKSEIGDSLWWNHMPAKRIKLQIGDDIWDSYFKFCVVRNPFDKVVSAYYYFNKEAREEANNALRDGTSVSPQLMSKESEIRKEKFHAWLTTAKLPFDRNQYLIDGQYVMDFVIRYESLNDGIREVCSRLGLPFEQEKVPRLKAGIRPSINFEDYYTKESVDVVVDFYAKEIELFHYSPPDV